MLLVSVVCQRHHYSIADGRSGETGRHVPSRRPFFDRPIYTRIHTRGGVVVVERVHSE